MRLFRLPGFGPLLAGQAVNAIGNWVAIIAIWGFASFQFDADASQIALLFVALSLPGALLGPLLGVVIDRLGPRRALIVANALGFLDALALTQADSYGAIIVLALPLGLIEALASASLDALPPRLVADRDLVRANALLGGAQDLAIVVGPVVAALVNARWGLSGAFLADAATFLVGLAVAVPLKVDPLEGDPLEADPLEAEPIDADPLDADLPKADLPKADPLDADPSVAGSLDSGGGAPHPSARRELREGLSLVRRTPGLRWTFGVAAVTYVLWGLFGVLEPLYVRDVLEASDTTFALLQTVFGVGLVASGLAIAALGDRVATPRCVALATIVSGITAALYLGTESLAVATFGVFLWGVDVAFFYVPAKTLLQRFTPRRAHGRVLSLNESLEPLSDLFVAPLAALAVGVLGVRLLGITGGVLAAVAGVVALHLARRLGPLPAPVAPDPHAGTSRDAIALGGHAPG